MLHLLKLLTALLMLVLPLCTRAQEKAEPIIPEGHGGAIGRFEISPDETLMLAGSADGKLILWDLMSLKPVYEIRMPQPKTGLPHAPVFKFSPDGKYFLTLEPSGRISKWNIGGELLDTLRMDTSACNLKGLSNLQKLRMELYFTGLHHFTIFSACKIVEVDFRKWKTTFEGQTKFNLLECDKKVYNPSTYRLVTGAWEQLYTYNSSERKFEKIQDNIWRKRRDTTWDQNGWRGKRALSSIGEKTNELGRFMLLGDSVFYKLSYGIYLYNLKKKTCDTLHSGISKDFLVLNHNLLIYTRDGFTVKDLRSSSRPERSLPLSKSRDFKLLGPSGMKDKILFKIDAGNQYQIFTFDLSTLQLDSADLFKQYKYKYEPIYQTSFNKRLKLNICRDFISNRDLVILTPDFKLHGLSDYFQKYAAVSPVADGVTLSGFDRAKFIRFDQGIPKWRLASERITESLDGSYLVSVDSGGSGYLFGKYSGDTLRKLKGKRLIYPDPNHPDLQFEFTYSSDSSQTYYFTARVKRKNETLQFGLNGKSRLFTGKNHSLICPQNKTYLHNNDTLTITVIEHKSQSFRRLVLPDKSYKSSQKLNNSFFPLGLHEDRFFVFQYGKKILALDLAKDSVRNIFEDSLNFSIDPSSKLPAITINAFRDSKKGYRTDLLFSEGFKEIHRRTETTNSIAANFTIPPIRIFEKDKLAIRANYFLMSLSKADVYSLDKGKVSCSINKDLVAASEALDGYTYFVDKNGMLGKMRLGDCQTDWNYHSYKNNDQLFINSDNYYFGSKDIISTIKFRKGKKLFDASQFDLEFNRPDLVLKSLGSKDTFLIKEYEKAHQRRLKKMGFSYPFRPGAQAIPSMQIINYDELPIFAQEPSLRLHLGARDSVSYLKSYQVWINSVPVFGAAGRSILAGKREMDEWIDLRLSAGRNKIQAAVMNEEGNSSAKKTMYIHYPETSTKQPAVWFLGLAADSFQYLPALKYTRNDVRSIAAGLSKKYSEVHVDTIFNSAITIENLERWKEKIINAGVDDLVVMAISTHGLLSDSSLYIASSGTDGDKPASTGISYDQLKDFFDASSARRKLLLLDICNSGLIEDQGFVYSSALTQAGDQQTAARGLPNNKAQKRVYDRIKLTFTDLLPNNGTVVIAAAQANESALEDSRLEHGYFSSAFLSGLFEGRADANSDGQVDIGELKRFLEAEVEQLSKGKQMPATRQEVLEMNWKF